MCWLLWRSLKIDRKQFKLSQIPFLWLGYCQLSCRQTVACRLSLVVCRLPASVCPVCPARPTVWLALSASEAACASACLSNYIVAMLHVKFFSLFFSYAQGNLGITERWRQGFEFGFGILTTAVSCQIYFNFLFAVECAKFSIPRQAGAATECWGGRGSGSAVRHRSSPGSVPETVKATRATR